MYLANASLHEVNFYCLGRNSLTAKQVQRGSNVMPANVMPANVVPANGMPMNVMPANVMPMRTGLFFYTFLF